MNYESMIMANRQQVKEISGKTFMSANLCRIEKVNEEDFTVDVFIIETSKTVKSVPICSPIRRLDKGFLSLPDVGSLCLVLTASSGQSFVIGFLSYSSSGDIDERLKSGEILLSSSDNNFLKLDDSGNVQIMSPGLSGTSIEKHTMDVFATTITERTLAKEVISGSINSVVTEIEKWYDRPIDCDLSTKSLIDNILNDKPVVVNTPLPVIEIQKGNVVDSGNIVKLQVYEDEANNPEACYRLVANKDGAQVFSIAIGKDGSCVIKGDNLIFDFNTLDMTKVKNIYPDPTQYDWAEE